MRKHQSNKTTMLTLGIIFIIVGIAIILFSALKNNDNSNTKIAIGGFIGFIPFGFANDKNMMYVLLGIMILALLMFILPYLLRH